MHKMANFMPYLYILVVIFDKHEFDLLSIDLGNCRFAIYMYLAR